MENSGDLYSHKAEGHNLGKPLSEEFCADVLGRPLTAREVDERNYNFAVTNLDEAVEKVRKYANWEVYVISEEILGYRIAVAVCIGPEEDPDHFQAIFLRQDMGLQ